MLRSVALISLLSASTFTHGAACDVGLAEVERGNRGRAIEALDACLGAANLPREARADFLTSRGGMLQADGRLEDASRDYEEVIRLRRETDIYDFFILADIYAAMHRYRQAHATLDRAHDLVGQLDARRHPALFQQIEFFRQKFTRAESASVAPSGAP